MTDIVKWKEVREESGMTFDALMKMGESLVPTGFLPQHIRTAGQVAAIIMAGRELGMQPMRALRSLRMIKGNVVEAADSQLARFKSDGGRGAFKVLTAETATLWLKHPNGDEHTETFSMDDAKAAGLLSNDTWRKFPKAMLRSRAITAGLKSVGWEGGIGTYDPDELQHIEHREEAEQTSVRSRAEAIGARQEERDVAAMASAKQLPAHVERPTPGPVAASREEAYKALRKLRAMIGTSTTVEDIAGDYDLWLDMPEFERLPDAAKRLADAYKTALVATVIGDEISADLAQAISKIDNL